MPPSTQLTTEPQPTCPPSFASTVFTDAFETWATAFEGTTDYWTRALARGAKPWDVARDAIRFWQVTTDRKRPQWATPNEIVLETPIARLRDFSTSKPGSVVPTLVLPPQAGHDSCIVDYSDAQSQVQTIRAAGLTRLLSLDWKGATQATKGTGVEDYLEVIDQSINIAGSPVNLVGDCQGGWLGTIYAALRPERVNTLTIAGAPIDFHAGGAVIYEIVQRLAPRPDLTFYRALVASGNGVLEGRHMLNGFIAIKPDNEVHKQLTLLRHLDDAEHVARYGEFEDWFKHTQDIPGAFYLWIVEHLFRDNALLHGELEIGGETVDLARIACPLNLLAGATDHITPPDQVFALAGAASTPPELVNRRITSGGHLGLFMGREALREHWPPLLAEVAEESRIVRPGRHQRRDGGSRAKAA